MNRKRIMLVAAALVLVLGLAVATMGSSLEDEIVARVNGQEITLEQYIATLEEQAGDFVLQQMIVEEIIRQKQEELGITVSDEQYEQFFNRLVAQLGGPQGIQQFLMESQMTIDQFNENLRFNLLVSELAKSEVTVTDEEVQEFFEANKDRLGQREEVAASHILVDTEEEGEELLARLDEGADFAELAKEYSQDTQSGARGGELGFFGRGAMIPDFEEAAFALGVDEYGLAQSEVGWHIIWVTDKKEARDAELTEVFDQIKDSLLAQKAMNPNEYVEKLRQSAEVEVLR